jgi:hypothetical protein
MSTLKGRNAIVMSTNICYMLADLMEMSLMDLEEIFENNNLKLHHAQKKFFKGALMNVRGLIKEVSHTPQLTQISFGNDSDMMRAMMLLILDRCGEDDEIMWKFYEYIKSFPSKLNLLIEDESAFAHIFEKDENEKES